MEMTHQQGSSGYVQQFADRIFAERGVRLGRVIQPRLEEAPPEDILDEGDGSGSTSVPGQTATWPGRLLVQSGRLTNAQVQLRADPGEVREHWDVYGDLQYRSILAADGSRSWAAWRPLM